MRKNFRSFALVLGIFLAATARAEDIDIYAALPATGGASNVVFALDSGASFNASSDRICAIDPTKSIATEVVRTDAAAPAGTRTALSGKNGGVEQCALYRVIYELDVSAVNVNVAVMVMNNRQYPYNLATGAPAATPCAAGVGGCLLIPLTRLTPESKTAFLKWIQGWESGAGADKALYTLTAPSNRGDGAMMQEIWAYLFRRTGMSGTDYSQAAYAPPPGTCSATAVIWLGNNWDTQASPKDATNVDGSPKRRLFGQMTGASAAQNASPAASDAVKATFSDTIPVACTATSTVVNTTLPTSEGNGAFMLNWASYLQTQGVPTSAVALQGPTCDRNYAAMMEKMSSSEVGGTRFYKSDDFTGLVNGISQALVSVLEKNTSFATVSVPVTASTQGVYLNQIYVGMFRPGSEFKPRWYGNLKQYKIGLGTTGVQLQDANGVAAISDGFIASCARSFWTPTTYDSYWEGNAGLTSCATNATQAKPSNFPDGEIVEKGGAAFHLRNMLPGNRKLFSCDATSATSCTAMLRSNVPARLGATDALTSLTWNTGSNDLVNWSIGLNTQRELSLGNTVMRPSVHGDVVHSRPTAVNYGTEASPNIVAYYGANDGIFRAVNGNRGCTNNASGACIPDSTGVIGSGTAAVSPGQEIWSFMAPEFVNRIKRLQDDTPNIDYPDAPGTGRKPKDYGFDGPVTSFSGLLKSAAGTGESKKAVFATMRRGGRAIYAFDVTDPLSPSLLWRRGCMPLTTDAATGAVATWSCQTGFERLGETWSAAKPVFVRGYEGGRYPLLIVGGGHDRCEDTVAGSTRNHTCDQSPVSGNPLGNRVYLMDPRTGDIVHTFTTERSVVADVTLVIDAGGFTPHAYAVDTGGNIYRLTLGGSETTWPKAAGNQVTAATKIAALGCDADATPTCNVNRKFMSAPSVVSIDDVTYHILVGSGDREKPAEAYSSALATNYFFMVMDRPTDSAWLVNACGTGNNFACLSGLADVPAVPSTEADLSGRKGWKMALAAKEQVVTAATTVFNVTNFSTYTPYAPIANNQSCRPEVGTAKLYKVNYKTAVSTAGATQRWETMTVTGIPSSPFVGKIRLDSGEVVPICIGCNARSPLEATLVTPTSSQSLPRRRTYYYIQK